MQKDTRALMVRLPADVKNFIHTQAKLNSSSQNSEIVRCVRERMDRTARESKTATE